MGKSRTCILKVGINNNKHSMEKLLVVPLVFEKSYSRNVVLGCFIQTELVVGHPILLLHCLLLG